MYTHRRFLCALPAISLAFLIPLHSALAQPPQDATALAELYRQFEQSQDPERLIALGEQALAMEPGVGSWTIKTSREAFKSELHAAVGQAYVNRAQGVRADNVEKAISNFEAVLTLADRNAADQWAAAHNDAGIAYWNRIRGERADNQEKALAHFETALGVFTREAYPQNWASLQSNLASLYVTRIRGDRSANIEAAISHLEGAQSVLTREVAPLPWAMTKSNLGNAYRVRVKGEAADNIETAIEHLEAALQVITRGQAPFQWGQIQLSLSVAHQSRKRGDANDNLKQALVHLQSAQSVFTREEFPLQWSGTQVEIGDVMSSLSSGDPATNRNQAIAAYEAALTVQTRDTAPLAHLEIAKALGSTLADAGECQAATAYHASAREAFLVLFGQGLEDADTRELVATAGPMFADAAYCAAELGNVELAVQLANESRARLLGVSLKLQNLASTPQQRRQLDNLRGAVREQQALVDAAHGADREAALGRLIATRKELLALIEDADPDGSTPVTAGAQAREVIDATSVLLMPVVTRRGTKMLIYVGAKQTWTVADFPSLTLAHISDLLTTKQESNRPGWIEAYFANYFEDPEEQSRRWPQWLEAVDSIGIQLWRLFGDKLSEIFNKQGVNPGTRLVLMPAGRLGVLPLGLAQNPSSNRRLIDDYEIVSAPSLEALVSAQRQIRTGPKPSLAVIINPTGDLPGSEKEGAIVASHFASDARSVLLREAATTDAVLAALKGKTYWHFATHGTFDWQDVRSSGLVMVGYERLSVSRLSEANDLGRPRLVVLSACETGLTDIVTSNPDEFIGLPNAFSALGAVGIVGTLWPVSDAATALLVAKFYDLHLDRGLSPPKALREAQLWLRDASAGSIDAYAQQSLAEGRLETRHLAEIKQDMDSEVRATRLGTAGAADVLANQKAAEPKPYAHPFYWGGFVYTGL